jgi:hypothetical protein
MSVGLASTQNGPTNPLRIGNVYFKPSDYASGYKVFFRVVLETTDAGHQANIDLVDVNNVLGNGAGAEVPGSLLQTTNTTGTDLEVELNAAGGNLETVGSNIMLLARIWLTTTLVGQSVTCSHAAILVQ